MPQGQAVGRLKINVVGSHVNFSVVSLQSPLSQALAALERAFMAPFSKNLN